MCSQPKESQNQKSTAVWAHLQALNDIDDTRLEKESNVALFSVIDCQFAKPTSYAPQKSLVPKMMRTFMAARDDVHALGR